MKFLITGTVRSNQGPRKIILFTYVLFFLFIISNFYLNLTRISFDYNEFIQLLEPSFTIRLEELHINLFLFGMYFLFNFAMLYQTRFSISLKNIIFFLSILYFIFYLFCLVYYSQQKWFFYFYLFGVVGFYVYLIFFQFLLLKDVLLIKNEK